MAGYLTTGSTSGIQFSKLAWGPVIQPFPTHPPHQDFTLDITMAGIDGRSDEARGLPLVRALSPVMSSPGKCARVILPRAEPVVIEVLDINGRIVRELLRDRLLGGETLISWDLKDGAGAVARPGMFFLRLRSSSGEGVARFAVLR